MGDIIATIIVALVVLWSASVVLRRFMPKTSLKVQNTLAMHASQHGFKKTAQWITAKNTQSGCGSCSNCGDTPASSCSDSEDKTQPVQWRSSKNH